MSCTEASDAVVGPDPFLEIRSATVTRGGRQVLANLSLSLHPGVEVLLGVNGAGKTTLLSVLLGLVPLRSGMILSDGDPLDHEAKFRRLRSAIGWLPQGFGFPRRMTAEDFVSYAGWLKRMPSSQLAARVPELFSASRLEGVRRRRMGELSGGERQRVGLIASIVSRPRLLILDEPTAGLDPIQRQNFYRLIHDITSAADDAMSVILSTHIFEDAAATADRLSVLSGGTISLRAPIEEFIGDDGSARAEDIRHRVTQYLAE